MPGAGRHHTDVARPTAPSAAAPLFRPEVLEQRQTRWLGTVLMAPQISYRLFTAFALVAAAAVLLLLIFGEFTRKARIGGLLVPQQGLVRVFAPLAGNITELYVREGDEVRAGARLLVLSSELQSEALGATRQEIVEGLIRRRASLIADRELQHRLYTQHEEDLADRLAALEEEHSHLETEISLQSERVKLAEAALARQRALYKERIVPIERLQRAEEERLDQASELRRLERYRSSVRRERVQLKGEARDLPLQYRTKLAAIDRDVSLLDQDLAEAEARREIVIPAPRSGTVTAIQAEAGGRTNISIPLLSIVPAGSELEAQLFSPSRAIGFVRPGQRVLLRYHAFPYQKFGHHEGVVAHISRTAVSPSELPQQLSGLTSLFGRGTEPVYRIAVRLERQTVAAYGEDVHLQPGMQVEADVLIERRRLIEWVLEPLFTLTGRLHG
ncbi:MAG: HlyD family efflux transporter periplasmic adaptor subunit [Rhodospirillales bacterium]|nr:HlyD family efflux transporter periplasmic adaptor subunit [Rhodospirillales bacterium]